MNLGSEVAQDGETVVFQLKGDPCNGQRGTVRVMIEWEGESPSERADDFEVIEYHSDRRTWIVTR